MIKFRVKSLIKIVKFTTVVKMAQFPDLKQKNVSEKGKKACILENFEKLLKLGEAATKENIELDTMSYLFK